MSVFKEILSVEESVLIANNLPDPVIKEVTHSLQAAYDADLWELLDASITALKKSQDRIDELRRQLEAK